MNRIHPRGLRQGPLAGGLTTRGGHVSETSHRKVLPRASAFWLVAIVLTLSLFAGTAPSPLYRIYEAQFRFSAATLTGIFAVYALAVLATLLVFGNLSDHIGRRPVIVAALAVNACACALFLIANGVTELLVARVLQGIAVGGGIGALGGALIDLQPGGSGLAPVINTGATDRGTGYGCTLHERTGSVRPGADAPGVVAPARSARLGCPRDPDHPRVRNPDTGSARFAASAGDHPARR